LAAPHLAHQALLHFASAGAHGLEHLAHLRVLTTVGVTIIYVPPINGTKVDLDNLARKAIIPAVHDILQPPITSISFWRRLKEIQPGEPNIEASIDRYKGMPPVHVMSYDVLCVDRLADDLRKERLCEAYLD
jgi:hypothetical protein